MVVNGAISKCLNELGVGTTLLESMPLKSVMCGSLSCMSSAGKNLSGYWRDTRRNTVSDIVAK